MLPVRCFTCGKVISALLARYEQLMGAGVTKRVALDQLGVRRFCCRTHFITITEHYTDIPVVEGDLVPGIASVARRCRSKRLIQAR